MTFSADEDGVMTPEEVARFLRVPVKTLYTWRYMRVGPPASRVGRHLRYRREAVTTWLVGQEGHD